MSDRRSSGKAGATCPDCPRISSAMHRDRKSTRLNSSHLVISYAVFCLKKKNKQCTLLTPAQLHRPIISLNKAYLLPVHEVNRTGPPSHICPVRAILAPLHKL